MKIVINHQDVWNLSDLLHFLVNHAASLNTPLFNEPSRDMASEMSVV